MRILVTGANGFVGRHAVAELATHGHIVDALDRPGTCPHDPGPIRTFFPGDISDPAALAHIVARSAPEACLHLAGMAFVPANQSDPACAFAVHIQGTINLLEAFRRQSPAARILVVTSAQVYGSNGPENATPVSEDAPLRPETPYAISKAAQDQIALWYARQHGLHVMTARPHNHTGPGQQPPFSVPSFARQVRAIARGEAPAELRTGNLESLRDFTDVRDVVRAYRLLLERGPAGHAFNIASGQLVAAGAILRQLCHLAGIAPRLVSDPDLYRPTDRSMLVSTTRIRQAVGWEPRIELATTLRDLMDAL